MSDDGLEDWIGREIRELRTGVALSRPAPHQSIFKYVSLNTKTSWDYLERMLESFELVGATATGLNDPFEMSPAIFDDLRPATISAAIGRPGMMERLRGEMPDPIEVDKHREIANKYIESVRRYWRVISLCERSDSPLLWSHYANSYKGACIHFLSDGFSDYKYRFGYVSYANHRPIYPLSLALKLSTGRRRSGDILNSESERFLFFTKAIEWAYESELRIIYNSNKFPSVKFSPDALVSIIAGPRMSEDDFDRLNWAVLNSPLAHIPVRRAKLSDNSFSVNIGGAEPELT